MNPMADPFVDVLFGPDELGRVLRAHIYVEAKLLELLDLLVKDQSSLRRMKLEFSQNVDLAVALGLSVDHASGLRAFGKLRNDFAHKLDTALSAERVRNLYEALSPGDKDYVKKAFKSSASAEEVTPRFEDLTPNTQFLLIATALYSILEAVVMNVKRT